MDYRRLRQLGIGGGLALVCLSILMLSLVQGSLYAPSQEEKQALSERTPQQILAEWGSRPWLPDHPLYSLKMIRDQVGLTISQDEARITRKLFLSERRLDTARLLVAKSRRSLALTTLTKSSKYILSAAEDIKAFHHPWDSPIGTAVRRSALSHSKSLEELKPYFTDEQRAVIDALMSQLKVVVESV